MTKVIALQELIFVFGHWTLMISAPEVTGLKTGVEHANVTYQFS
ncbi:hypothetical protein OU994_25195 [Pseudoduganella sp. SL102]|nr:hypothetical protein [Pseudoduganella sp. SL102]WBS01539.1 hypothetical protein OU994_25195 [Pseudoduganella sp. SL102]